MSQNQIYQLVETLKSKAKSLNIESTSQLYRDIEAISAQMFVFLDLYFLF